MLEQASAQAHGIAHAAHVMAWLVSQKVHMLNHQLLHACNMSQQRIPHQALQAIFLQSAESMKQTLQDASCLMMDSITQGTWVLYIWYAWHRDTFTQLERGAAFNLYILPSNNLPSNGCDCHSWRLCTAEAYAPAAQRAQGELCRSCRPVPSGHALRHSLLTPS